MAPGSIADRVATSLLMAGGFALVTYGLWRAYEPAAFIFAGIGCLIAALGPPIIGEPEKPTK